MKNKFSISFGEKVDDYNVPVFNEREVRAAAGILFLIGVIGAFIVLLTGGLQITRIFIVGFV